ncbi:9936_t:CDS:1, partial [Racocetra persica]
VSYYYDNELFLSNLSFYSSEFSQSHSQNSAIDLQTAPTFSEPTFNQQDNYLQIEHSTSL